MTSRTAVAPMGPQRLSTIDLIGTVLVTIAFFAVFAPSLWSLGVDWWSSGEYGHGFILLPISLWLAYRDRLVDAKPAIRAGLSLMLVSGVVFLLGSLSAERFFERTAILSLVAGLTLYFAGWAQLRAWWLPFALLASTIPLPEVFLDSVTAPLQLFASETAVAMLSARHVPVGQAGNVIFLPGHELFVAAACSGLRSISALTGLTLLIAASAVRSAPARIALLALAVPAAILANSLRVFLTGMGVYYVGPQVAHGLPHHAMAAVAFALPLGVVGLVALGLRKVNA